MIVITGAAGFIGSYVAQYFAEQGRRDVVLVDDFSKLEKQANWKDKPFERVERDEFLDWLAIHGADVVIHLGARTDTTEFDYDLLTRLNLHYTQDLWRICSRMQIPFIYASSAATYGGGEFGYVDDHQSPFDLKPLNPYGVSKNEFDKWALVEEAAPPRWVGLKFFNVYGPNEYHKGRMASVVFHAFKQIQQTGGMKLFRSHHPEYKDGEQLRDFIYVKDVAKVIYYLATNSDHSGLLNLGTGQARTFNDLVSAVFGALGLPANISYIDTPEDIRDKYQYYTEADMKKLNSWGYPEKFASLEAGVEEYVTQFLQQDFRIY